LQQLRSQQLFRRNRWAPHFGVLKNRCGDNRN
jgi:hypothetical protein